jgi:hypothetical protein
LDLQGFRGGHGEASPQVQALRFLVRRDLGGRTVQKYVAGRHYIQTVADLQGLADVVVGEEHADPGVGQGAQVSGHLLRGLRVEAGEGLVAQQEPRPRGQAAQELRATPLAPAQRLAARPGER